jgi:serine/threonine protein kinase
MGNAFGSRPRKLAPRTSSAELARSSAVAVLRNKDMKISNVNQYELLKPLGRGSFGDVYLATDGTAKYAIKILKKSALLRQRQGKVKRALSQTSPLCSLLRVTCSHGLTDAHIDSAR